jgi:hypothetical protein
LLGLWLFAALHTVEFQKRGLPHADVLIWLDRLWGQIKDLPREASSEFIDGIASAELPDVVADPLA